MNLAPVGSTETVCIKRTNPDPSQAEVPSAELFVFECFLNGKQYTVFKDDGCSTNIVSMDFMKQNIYLIQIKRKKTVIKRYNKEDKEKFSFIVSHGKIQID